MGSVSLYLAYRQIAGQGYQPLRAVEGGDQSDGLLGERIGEGLGLGDGLEGVDL